MRRRLCCHRHEKSANEELKKEKSSLTIACVIAGKNTKEHECQSDDKLSSIRERKHDDRTTTRSRLGIQVVFGWLQKTSTIQLPLPPIATAILQNKNNNLPRKPAPSLQCKWLLTVASKLRAGSHPVTCKNSPAPVQSRKSHPSQLAPVKDVLAVSDSSKNKNKKCLIDHSFGKINKCWH